MKFAASLNRIISPPDQNHADINAGIFAAIIDTAVNQIFNRLKTQRALPSKIAALAAASSAVFASI